MSMGNLGSTACWGGLVQSQVLEISPRSHGSGEKRERNAGITDNPAFRYHVGSLAFGALILTLVQIVRIILEYIDHKTKG